MYEEFLRRLLAPLGIYRLDRDSLSGAELYALGRGLDAVSDRLDEVEREGVTATAEDEGLRRREALFLRRPASTTLKERRGAIAALLQIDGDSLTPEASTSMQRDVKQGKASEMDGLIFEVVRMGRKYGVKLPVYEKVAEELRKRGFS